MTGIHAPDPNTLPTTLTGPLRLLTLSTHDLTSLQECFVKILGMKLEGPFEISGDHQSKLRKYYDISEEIGFEIYQLLYEEETQLSIRVISLDKETPLMRGDHPEPGIGAYAVSIGYGDDPKQALSTDGLYLNGPENLKIHMAKKPLSMMDDIQVRQMLSTKILTDVLDEEALFYKNVLGMDGIAAKQRALSDHYEGPSIICRPHDYVSQHIELTEIEPKEEGVTHLRLPNRGICMHTYETADVGEVLARAHAGQIKAYRTPRTIVDPILGDIISMLLLSPSGYLVEIYTKN